MLVSLSIGVAIFASYAALLVSQNVTATTVIIARRLWIGVGGLCLGVGIWATHFVGMLAFSLPCSTSYDVTTTLLSTIPGILVSTLAIKIISHRDLSLSRLASGGLLIGAGIGTMHYAGMAAMHINGLIVYDAKLFMLSILIAVVLATFALWIKFRLQSWKTRWEMGVTMISAMVMGLAVFGMHYTAMASSHFVRDNTVSMVDSDIASTFLAAIVLGITSLIIVVTIAATYTRKFDLFSMGRSYQLIGLLVVGWGIIAWLSIGYYYNYLTNNLYQRELQLSLQQAEEIAGNIDKITRQLNGISLVFSHDKDTLQALRRFGANAAPSTLAYEQRKQSWTSDKLLGEVNDSLGFAAVQLGVDNIFIINAAGDCVAAGNADKPGSSVGSNFADRGYFPQVQAGQQGYQYAVGRTTNIPGLYYASPVFEAGRFLGAVVVKLDITKFAYWITQANAFIVDANGVIVLASDKRLEFLALSNASVEKLSSEKLLMQYKRSELEPLEMSFWKDSRFPSVMLFGGKPVILVSKTMPENGMSVYVPHPLGELVRLLDEQYWLFLLIATVGSMLIVAAWAIVLYLRESQQTAADLRIAATAFESQEGILITDPNNVILRQSR